MKTNINTKDILLNFNDKPFKAENDKDMTIGEAIIAVISAPRQSYKIDVFKIYSLCQDLNKKNEIELDEDEFSKIIETIETGSFAPVFLGALKNALLEYQHATKIKEVRPLDKKK